MDCLSTEDATNRGSFKSQSSCELLLLWQWVTAPSSYEAEAEGKPKPAGPTPLGSHDYLQRWDLVQSLSLSSCSVHPAVLGVCHAW